jgi:hypothetical protein
MNFNPFITTLENDSESLTARKLREASMQEYAAFAEATRSQLQKGFLIDHSSTPTLRQHDVLVKHLDSVVAVRHAKEQELARLKYDLGLMNRRCQVKTSPRAYKKKLWLVKDVFESQRMTSESYEHLKDRSSKALLHSKAKVSEIERRVALLSRRLSEANGDLLAVSSALSSEMSQLYLIEGRSIRIKEEQVQQLEKQKNSQRQTSEMMKLQEQAFITKKFLANDSRKHINVLKARLVELKQRRTDNLKVRVVCILQRSRVKLNMRKLTDTFGSSDPDQVIYKFDEFNSQSASLKTAINDKVQCISGLLMQQTQLKKTLKQILEQVSSISIKASRIAASKQEITAVTELSKKKRANDHLKNLSAKAETVHLLASNGVYALQTLLKKLNFQDPWSNLGPKVDISPELPRTLDVGQICSLLLIIEKKLTTALKITGQQSQARLRRFKLQHHIKFMKQSARVHLGQVFFKRNIEEPLQSESALSFRGIRSRAETTTSSKISLTEVRTSMARIMTRHFDISLEEDETPTLDRKSFKESLKKNRTVPKLKIPETSPLTSPKSSNWELTLKQMIKIDKERAQLNCDARTLSKPTSPQPSELTRKLKFQLKKVSSCRALTSRNSRASPKLQTPRLIKLRKIMD